MAKKIYEFDLETEGELIDIFDKARNMDSALFDILNFFRNALKHNTFKGRQLKKSEYNLFTEIREQIHDILSENEIA